MANYILKKIDDAFWREIKKLAIDKKMTIKGLIILLLKNELTKHRIANEFKKATKEGK